MILNLFLLFSSRKNGVTKPLMRKPKAAVKPAQPVRDISKLGSDFPEYVKDMYEYLMELEVRGVKHVFIVSLFLLRLSLGIRVHNASRCEALVACRSAGSADEVQSQCQVF